MTESVDNKFSFAINFFEKHKSNNLHDINLKFLKISIR